MTQTEYTPFFTSVFRSSSSWTNALFAFWPLNSKNSCFSPLNSTSVIDLTSYFLLKLGPKQYFLILSHEQNHIFICISHIVPFLLCIEHRVYQIKSIWSLGEMKSNRIPMARKNSSWTPSIKPWWWLTHFLIYILQVWSVWAWAQYQLFNMYQTIWVKTH